MERNSEVFTPRSLLDPDLYQQAIAHHFPETQAVYRFTSRDPDVLFPRRCADLLHKSAQQFRSLRLTTEEKNWLADTCPYFSTEYLGYLAKFRFNPAQISIKFFPVSDDGEWGRVEIELYFRVGATDWSYEGQQESASTKAQALLAAGCTFSEFGTQRRRSFHAQELVVAALKQEADRLPGCTAFSGTSNPCLAKKYGIHPVGTIAHEWFYGDKHQGCEGANVKTLALWQETYPNDSFVALTDTFSTKVFFEEFAKDRTRAEKWTGLRQDSGNPFEFAPAAKATYERMGVDNRTKTIIYSDALTLDRVLQLKKHCGAIGFRCSFGIGTFLTNGFKTKSSDYTEKSRALNMVIKLAKVDDRDCVKITDDPSKHTGDKISVESVKKLYRLPKRVNGNGRDYPQRHKACT